MVCGVSLFKKLNLILNIMETLTFLLFHLIDIQEAFLILLFFFLVNNCHLISLYEKNIAFECFRGTFYIRKALKRKQDTLTTVIY